VDSKCTETLFGTNNLPQIFHNIWSFQKLCCKFNDCPMK